MYVVRKKLPHTSRVFSFAAQGTGLSYYVHLNSMLSVGPYARSDGHGLH